MNRRQFIALAFTTPIGLTGCTTPKQSFHETIAVFGTLVNITLYTNGQQQAIEAFAAVNARFQQIHTDWHAWEKGGLISKINQAISEGLSLEINAEVVKFIQHNQQLCQQTLGLFDPGIGKLIKLWGFHQNSYEGNRHPDPKAVTELLAQKPSIMDITWQGNKLFCANPAVSLDFGASGKAYALNAATETLSQQGITQATIAIGGDIQVLGNKPNGVWHIGINDPEDTSKAKMTLTLADGEAICSSGTYQRFYIDQGKKVSHVIHPHTGQPVTHILHSSVLHHNSLIAEVGALSQLIATPEEWQKIAQTLGISLYYHISADQQEEISPALTARIHTSQA
jgi:thiamine biosynthesis lipoprotein